MKCMLSIFADMVESVDVAIVYIKERICQEFLHSMHSTTPLLDGSIKLLDISIWTHTNGKL